MKKLLVLAAFLVGSFLGFEAAVWLTDLAIGSDPCVEFSGELSCLRNPGVLAATLITGTIFGAFAWLLITAGRLLFAAALVIILVAASGLVIARYRLDCGGGLRLGIVSNGEGTSPSWECLGGVK